jgi:hypothetical protein
MTESSIAQQNPKAALQQVFTLLKARDDTSRFVGLSLLRSLLDANDDLRNDDSVIRQCWEAVPNKFLMRLMKARGADTEEVKNMNDLAVAVVHTFANLLSADQIAEKKMLDLSEPLIEIIPILDAAPQMLAFQALQCLASCSAGAHILSRSGKQKELARPASENQRYLKEYLKLYDIAWSIASDREDKQALFQSVIETVKEVKNTEALVNVLASLSLQLSFMNQLRLRQFIVRLIHRTITTRPTAAVRNAAIKLVSEVLRHSPSGSGLGNDFFSGKHPSSVKEDEKPFAYVFMQYVLIDLRSTIPSLMTNLASPVYQTDSLRLAACYDVVAAFVMYLIQSMDEDITEGSAPSPLSPDLLLKIRRDLSETFSLTLELFRDRWDAVISGARGLDPSARTDPKAPAMLTWDNPTISPEQDPLILSGLRALSLWIREDDNPQLNKQTMSIADMLAALYETSMKEHAKTDFRLPILVLLEGLLPEDDEAVQLLLDHNGWDILAMDLEQSTLPLRQPQNSSRVPNTAAPHTRDLIRVLLAMVISDTSPQTRENWMNVVKWASDIGTGGPWAVNNLEGDLETVAELFQLADAIVSKAPKRLQKLFDNETKQIAKTARIIVMKLGGQGVEEGLMDSFREVAAALAD